jgi:hypothetical protein
MFAGRTDIRSAIAVAALAVLLAGCGARIADDESGGGQAGGGQPVSTSAPPEFMPDLVGQQEDQARAALVEFNVQVTTDVRIAPQPEGTVIEQDPVAGSPFPQRVTLVISIAPPEVPDVTGQTFGTAQSTLEDLGFTVTEEPIFDSQRVDGLVVEQDPAAGATNAGEVVLSVVRRPVVSYFSDIEPVTYDGIGYVQGTAKSNGKSYGHGVYIESYSEGVGSVEYDLSRQYRRVVGEMGLEDQTSSDGQFKVEIYGDGRLLTEASVDFGTTVPVEIDVTDVLRLKITIAALSGEGGVVLGDLRAEGLESEVRVTPTPAP